MRKSKAFVITKPGEYVFKEIDMPSIGQEEVLIEVKACGICTTDRRIYSGKINVPFPLIGGHEVAGEVIEIGDKIDDIDVNSRVTVDAINRCGHCYYCRRGMDNLCVNSNRCRNIGGDFLIAGGFSEYMIARRKQVFTFTNDIDFKEAAMTEPLSCCLHSIKKTNLSFGDTALIVGGGTMGILHAQIARLKGAKVIISDPDVERREFANELGFTTVEPRDAYDVSKNTNDGLGVDAVFITAPALSVANEAIDYIRKGGHIVLYTSVHPSVNISIDWNKVHYKEAVVTGTEGRTIADFREANALISESIIDVGPIVTKTVGLDGLPDELLLSPHGRDQRTVLVFK